MDNYNIDTFFDVTYNIINTKPKISIKLKSKYKTKPIPSINGNSKEYYTYYMGNELGSIAYDMIRSLMAYHKRVSWYIKTYEPDNIFLIQWLDDYERTRINSVRKKYQDVEFQERFKKCANNPTRTEKISIAAKRMWQLARQFDHNKIRNMIYSNSRKSFEFNGVQMNSIEFIMASLLNSLSIVYEYETVHTIDKKTYVPDFYIHEYNLVIECFGDYWHANPKIYNKESMIFRHPACEIYKRDAQKRDLFLSAGYQYVVFWEYDLRNNLELIKQQLCSILKKK
jgi:G:T-mismatch repair DNA endonuclease (very short patch repair protein)